MNVSRSTSFQLDWIAVIIFTGLVIFGYFNILSASNTAEFTSYFDITKPYGKQLIFILGSLLLISFILSVEAKFYERFASILYIGSMLSLIGLFIAGKQINGATSWYSFGGLTLQPSEFAKFATALALAKFISDLQTNIKNPLDQFKAGVLVALPAVLILFQNDAGSTIVFGSLFFVFYREGISQYYLFFAVFLTILGISTLKFSAIITNVAIASLLIFYQLFLKRKKRKFKVTVIAFICSITLSFGIQWAYNEVLQKHQQDRIGLWLRLEKDPVKLESMKRNISYNLNESEKAIRSGGVFGKGFMEGTRTKGKFVPEQHTDYIFSTVGEEWGFFGSSVLVILFVSLILRIIYLAEQHKSQFSRIYGYGVASILFAHFLINIGMVMGLIPTIGIPLPFFSYGGSGLWAFTILVFIFLKLDSNRLNVW
jgi:rod shape determining protein RodA